MRTIKFRVWNKVTHTMHYPDWKELSERAELPEMVLMQFTGLKDKNGKEIYEGDIFLITKEPQEDNTVEFYEGEYQLSPHGFSLSDWYEQGEVIGNIYENPELLEACK